MARITATEMVGPQLTTAEVRRLIAAVERAPEEPVDAELRKKLSVMLQVAEATERRREKRQAQQAK